MRKLDDFFKNLITLHLYLFTSIYFLLFVPNFLKPKKVPFSRNYLDIVTNRFIAILYFFL